jgi:8-oxo-dGTP diphosphatase
VDKEIDKLAWLYIQDGKLLSARSKNRDFYQFNGEYNQICGNLQTSI